MPADEHSFDARLAMIRYSTIGDGSVSIDRAFPRACRTRPKSLWRDTGCDPHNQAT
jgi:hypothetical protein